MNYSSIAEKPYRCLLSIDGHMTEALCGAFTLTLLKFKELFPLVGQWRLSLSPDGETEPWSILGGKRKKH